ncbi:hypothetical protein [Kitasatospora sp. NPDC056184]|uniref:hypothetical protein n=1 Tax=Kitasatospora sp. NPDC056184 TaxID=3345738 RepID=UPI0035E01B51
MTPAPAYTAVPKPVLDLLDLSGHARDVPAAGAPLAPGWLPSIITVVRALLADADPNNAHRSYTGHGRTDLYLGTHDQDSWYLRLAADNHTAPTAATDKAAVLTLTGTALLEGYANETRAEAGQPQYMREFGPESVHFVYPGTVHTAELSHDACQLVVVRGTLTVHGTVLTGDQYLDAALEAREYLAATLTTTSTASLPTT